MSKMDYWPLKINNCACGGAPIVPKSGEAERIECDSCGMCGPIGVTPEEVAAVWNKTMESLRMVAIMGEVMSLLDDYFTTHMNTDAERGHCGCELCERWRALNAKMC
jgi:hypothetical protein